ncbi:MAG: 8-amino-7-oxononanoate synthase [Elusimicrobia bacterium]|nr:8-amino-7-oxononanoate synthase [Elusimicrobiota bacterium]
MSPPLLHRLSRELSALRSTSRHRALKPAAGVDFTSNDYLGLARHPALAEAVRAALDRTGTVGSGGSRLLRGNHPEHEALEAAAAKFFGSESALYCASGFDANLALFSTLPSRRGAIVLDERVHASVKEGARASFAKKYTARHNDLASFDAALTKARAAGVHDVFMAVESVYSMDGDRAPLAALLALAESHEATLVVDEAHATGLFGPHGRGLCEGMKSPLLVCVHTASKALGASGALVSGSRLVTEYLVNAARPFIYSTAPSPLIAAAVRRALALIDEEPWRRERVHSLVKAARRLLPPSLSRWTLGGELTPILPVFIGAEDAALSAARYVSERGLDVRAIRPPTVPEGTSRLRLSLNAGLDESDLVRLAKALKAAEADGA